MISNSIANSNSVAASIVVTSKSGENSNAFVNDDPINTSKDTSVISPLARQLAAADTQATSSIGSNTTAQKIDRGMSIVTQRLYGGQANAPVLSPQIDFNRASSSTQFLNLEDRKLLGEMYDYAQQQGADFYHVDTIAMSLGAYRQHSDGKMMLSFNGGGNFDIEGHALTVDFNEKDAATAARIRNSDAINSTKIDRGFLNYALDPGFGALSNAFDLDFIEQMVIKFSEQDASIPLGAKFAKYAPIPIPQKVRYTASKEVTLKPIVADYTSIDGVGHWRTPELAETEQNVTTTNKPSQITDLIKSVLEKIRTSDRDNLVMLHRFEPSSPVRRFKFEK